MSEPSGPKLNRREFISTVLLTGSYVIVKGPLAFGQGAPHFFNSAERAILAQACESIMEGASRLGAVNYIEILLTAFENTSASQPPRIYAAGPFSGRFPYGPNLTPKGKSTVPAPDFSKFLPLTREQRLTWMLKLYGPQSIGGWQNNRVLAKDEQVVGLRDLIRFGIHYPQRRFDSDVQPGLTFDDPQFNNNNYLRTNQRWLRDKYQLALQELTLQACFSCPEYGGNPGGAGWNLIQYPGDRSPLGYSIWNPAQQRYLEDPQFPVSTAGPDKGPPLEGWVDDYFGLVEVALGLGLGGVRKSK